MVTARMGEWKSLSGLRLDGSGFVSSLASLLSSRPARVFHPLTVLQPPAYGLRRRMEWDGERADKVGNGEPEPVITSKIHSEPRHNQHKH